jgi:hypothetical protein
VVEELKKLANVTTLSARSAGAEQIDAKISTLKHRARAVEKATIRKL